MEDFIRCLQDNTKSNCRFDYNNLSARIPPETLIRDYVYNFVEEPGILECLSKSSVERTHIQEVVTCSYIKDPHNKTDLS